MSNIQQLKTLAESCKGWDNLDKCSKLEGSDEDWSVGACDEDGNFFPVMAIDTDQYDQSGDAVKLAQYYAAANPAAVLELISELEKVKADRKACWEEFKVQGRQLDLVKDENESLRPDARRWQCVRNAVPMQSPYAVWREGSHLVLGKDADELVDNFLSHTKEVSHD